MEFDNAYDFACCITYRVRIHGCCIPTDERIDLCAHNRVEVME